MRNLVDRAIPVAGYAVGGYLLVFLVAVSVTIIASAVALASGVSALDLDIGPMPLMSFNHNAAGYGFQSEWGVAVLAYVGAMAGAVLAIRRQITNRSR